MSSILNNLPSDRLEPARRAIATRDFVRAQHLLSELIGNPAEPIDTWLMLASVYRAGGRLNDALTTLDRALSREPRHFLALLMRASVLERLGNPEAPEAYGIALELMPAEVAFDPATQKAIEKARQVHDTYIAERRSIVMAAGADALTDASLTEKWAAERFIDDALRVKRRFHQEPAQFYYPGLPAIEFYDRGYFPWLQALESQWEAIRDELLSVIDEDLSGFAPYIQYADRLPLDQWRQLNRNPDWSAFHLIDGGGLNAKNASRCPKTLRALAPLPQPRIPGRGPSAMFSALKPHTRIPPHTGISNTRLVVHLPLIVPKNCGFRVGNEVRNWVPGQAWVFDDTIEHEAWNDSDEVRSILIFDIWSPFLSLSQQVTVTQIMTAMDDRAPNRPASGPGHGL
ncbi:MAG: aspartyl/asparaginyl beta-hydroxylase domain-containing protein [Asticcacaulis sp.]|uniref:aspartyl/asparaginyl beta-hydroxylase domain-containing protein n=1 Tax=Asticcacaulis sp. TaxID=1872648 RepID=UPI0039E4B2A3